MKNSKKIFMQAVSGLFLYSIPCLGGAYESHYRGANLSFTARIIAIVIIFVFVGAIISLLKKEYDPRKYNGYILLFVSLGLLLQIMVQGEISSNKRVEICIVGYIVAFLFGIIVGLFATKTIIVKNIFLKNILKIVATILSFITVAICATGRMFFGRRGEILVEMTGGQENSTRGLWYCFLGLTLVYAFISALAIIDVKVAPDYYKNKRK